MNFIDLFSGAGGLSEGFIRAGFNPIAHVESDKAACKTLETRMIFHRLKGNDKEDHYYDYLRGSINREKFVDLYSDIELKNSIINAFIGGSENKQIFQKIDFLLKGQSIDLIVGGPPCQAYSLVGRSRDANRMVGDPRNHLYKEYAKFLKYYKPKIFVFENVIGLISADEGWYFKNMQGYFKAIGYKLDYKVLKSEEFGVLQKRRRIILIGWQEDMDFKYPEFEKRTHNWTIKNLLDDLPSLKPGEEMKLSKYLKKDSNSYLESFQLKNGVDFVTQHIARPHNSRDLEIYKIATNKFLNNNERLKYPDLPDSLKTHKNQKSFLDRFKVVDINGLSHTMVAHIAKDGHHYIYPSQDQIRSISVREAARIQSFPDDFYFEGGRTAAFRQIGNAVPPLMAREIAKEIKVQLE
ncbi:DNA cytosine methyltransferase [Marivirga sp. S37H4]|uniref:Cytosine-specific methyltransferase n=1 Tax=Marivirga aurantiaca TaxID=2802615 RepID=A0A934WWI6_9BACT|nr:DNA cytosine methyltransferase [Marivirga aurantiaca]MBK6264389.1 DNA cytosine methyltransferase [Marivirga aurantiaca]